MKKYIATLLLFGLYAVFFYTFALFLAPPRFKPNLNYIIGSYGHMYSRLKEVKDVKDVDILFLGSSHAYRGFDPRIFKANGYTSFNLGSSAQTPIQTEVLLRRYLIQINPKLIIYEVSPGPFSSDGVESALDIISNDRNDVFSLQMALELNHIKVYNTLLYGSISDIFNLNSSFIEPRKKRDDTYISGGFVEKEIQFFAPEHNNNRELYINESQLIAFKKALKLIAEQKIELILVYAPITSSLYNSYTNNEYFDRIMMKSSEYYNFNEILHLDDSLHFYNSQHLNQNGVEIFNSKLIEIINEKWRAGFDTGSSDQ
jgi:hypothetical protein